MDRTTEVREIGKERPLSHGGFWKKYEPPKIEIKKEKE
jgi:hypothetical protein